MALLGVRQGLAATVTSASDTMSTQTVSANANHTIVFTTPSGVSEGQTVTVSFESDFNTASITEDDVDVADDSTDLTTAATCAGSEQASVSMASDVLTVTICAGDGGAVGAGSVVTIEIGTQATASGTGTNAIVNPGSSATYFLAINGTFADFGSIAVPIVGDGDLAVTATVESGGGGGGGGGGGSSETEEDETSDATAPVIADVEVSTTTQSAAVSFTTDESATCQIDYGQSESYGSSVAETSSDTVHSLDIADLVSETEYFFRLICEDASGNSSEIESSFTTETDVAPGSVSDLSCSASNASIDFTWSLPSDDDLASLVLTCDSSDYPTDSEDGALTLSGSASTTSASLDGLVNGTTYYCAVFAFDLGGHASAGALTTCTPSATTEDSDTGGETTSAETGGEETVVEEEPTIISDESSSSDDVSVDEPESPTTEEVLETLPEGEAVQSGTGVSGSDVRFSDQSGQVTLEASDDSLTVIAEEPFTILIPSASITDKEVETIYVVVDGQAYVVSEVTSLDGVSGYRLTIDAPAGGEYDAVIRLIYTDGTTEDVELTIDAVSQGYVYEIVNGEAVRIEGAVVTLEVSIGGQWEVVDVVISDERGAFAWYVDNGLYRLRVQKDGYAEKISAPFVVDEHIATALVRLTRIPPTIAEVLASDADLPSKALGVTKSAAFKVSQGLDALRQVREVQIATDIAVPTVIALGIGTLSVLASSFQLWPLLQYLFTSPILIASRRRRKGWGVVYNAGSKLPIDLAVVRLYRLSDGALVSSRVTDKLGRYFFLADPGEYRLVAVKPGLSFPSEILEGAKEDGPFLDVYHGEPIQVSEQQATIAANIPLDPSQKAEGVTAKKLALHKFLRGLQQTTAILGVIFALAILLVRPSLLTAVGLLVQMLIYVLARRLAKPRSTKNWGIVYSAKDGRALSQTVVRIFEPKYNKLLESALTDAKGRYSFLVGPSNYFTTYEKPGFVKQEIRPIDKTGQEASEVAIDVKLEPTSTKQHPSL